MNYHIPTAYVITHATHLEWVVLDNQIKAQEMKDKLLKDFWKRNFYSTGYPIEQYIKDSGYLWKIKEVQYGEYTE